MHLLFISSLLPDAVPASGFEIATQAIADEYRRQGVRLSLAGFRRHGGGLPKAGEIPLGDLVLENAGAARSQKMAWIVKALRRKLPISAAKLAVIDEAELRDRLASAGPVDGYILNSIQMPTAFPFLVRDKPSIFVAHNVEHRSAAENAGNAGSLAMRLLYRREAALLKTAEAQVCRDTAVIHSLSREDGVALGVGDDPRLRPLSLSIGRPAFADDPAPTHDIGLIGTWSWAPNRVGLDWFVTEVAPLLPSHVTVAIAGRFDARPPAAPRNVSFIGRVPDAQAFVRSSRVIALATRGGTGVQLKTIETFEEGMPAVATTSALRGVDRLPGNVIVADSAAEFANALSEMVAVERAGENLRLDGRTFAREQKRGMTEGVRSGILALESALSRSKRPSRGLSTDASIEGTRLQTEWVGRT